MDKKEFRLSYEEYGSDEALEATDADLLNAARRATADAYAPYSHFRVGAAARLVNGVIITGANQENASFPAGICAERTLLSVAGTQYPDIAIETLAISYRNGNGASDRPVSPCGICRQSLSEYEWRMGRPMRLIMAGTTGKVWLIEEAGKLLPLAFTAEQLASGK